MFLDEFECAVVIPIYKSDLSPASVYSISRNFKIMKNRKFYFVCPVKLKKSINEIFSLVGFEADVKYFPDKYFESISSYNRLMMSGSFYRRFKKYQYILICQDDALVISDELSFWCGKSYSYVGAPWFVGFDNPKTPLKFYGVGNGGLSLRKVKDYIKFLSRIRLIKYPDDIHFPKKVSGFRHKLKNFIKRNMFILNVPPLLPRVNEDIFWGHLAPLSESWFTIPDPAQALKFAFEVSPRECLALNNNVLPFGCHAWERYDRDFWVEQLNIKIDTVYRCDI